MQLSSRHPFRYRGWRQSAPLVELIHAPAADFKGISGADYANQTDYLTARGYVETLADTRVSELQHLRVQLRYRLTPED